MKTFAMRPLIGLFGVSSAMVLIFSPTAATAAAGVLAAKGGAHASKIACSQLTKAQVQPLIVNPITKVTVKAVTAEQYTGSTKRIGQECVFAAGSSDSEALVVTVISGPVAARAYAADVQGLSGAVAVPGVGTKAMRAPVDAKGAAATTTLSALKGTTYCSVSPGDGDVPGEGQLEEAAGASPDIGNKAYAEIAAAVGTVCNRIFGSGKTTPDLSGLTQAGAAAPTSTTTFPDGLDIQP
jgi:hypothetical protein